MTIVGAQSIRDGARLTAMEESSDRLTATAHWDAVHRTSASSGRLRAVARTVLGEEAFDFFVQGGYVGYTFRELLRPLVRPGQRILEVGSAPGLALAKLARALELDPWGLDYSEAGVVANRATFTSFGFDPGHVLLADFFGDAIVADHGAGFDLVMSHGFIEHFRDVRPVVARHVALTRPGGLVAISIPNYAGLNAALKRFFHPDLLAAHNLDIMSRDRFAELFDDQGLAPIFCGYLGSFQFGLLTTPPTSPKRHLLAATRWLQIPLDLAQRRLFGANSPELPGLSPYLYYVGRRLA